MKYSFTCPAPCNAKLKVDANSDDEAIRKLVVAGMAHAAEAHPDMDDISDAEMRKMMKAGLEIGS
ncbi:MAG: hypothetical protein PHY31_00065 [Smithellaceae bacterium]|nr:hypothetical protein [Smithellaceae bacterium]